jgi:hypothetical protein
MADYMATWLRFFSSTDNAAGGNGVVAIPSYSFVQAHETSARERTCEKNLFLFQCEGVNIVCSHVAKQHWRVCRIKTHPKAERPCGTESLQVDNALRIATRHADSKHARIIREVHEVDELAIRRPHGKITLAHALHYRPPLRLKVEDFHASCGAGVQPGEKAAVG